jgi:hypothetical protein
LRRGRAVTPSRTLPENARAIGLAEQELPVLLKPWMRAKATGRINRNKSSDLPEENANVPRYLLATRHLNRGKVAVGNALAGVPYRDP